MWTFTQAEPIDNNGVRLIGLTGIPLGKLVGDSSWPHYGYSLRTRCEFFRSCIELWFWRRFLLDIENLATIFVVYLSIWKRKGQLQAQVNGIKTWPMIVLQLTKWQTSNAEKKQSLLHYIVSRNSKPMPRCVDSHSRLPSFRLNNHFLTVDTHQLSHILVPRTTIGRPNPYSLSLC